MPRIVLTIVWEGEIGANVALVEPKEANILDLLSALNAAMTAMLLQQRQREIIDNEEESDE